MFSCIPPWPEVLKKYLFHNQQNYTIFSNVVAIFVSMMLLLINSYVVTSMFLTCKFNRVRYTRTQQAQPRLLRPLGGSCFVAQ